MRLTARDRGDAGAPSPQRIRRRRAALAVVWTVIVIAACNIDGEVSTSFGRGPSGPFFDAGGAPITEPRPEPCDFVALHQFCQGRNPAPAHCEIGQHPNPVCNLQVRCTDTWEVEQDAATCEDECPTDLVPEREGGCDIPNARTIRCEYPDDGYTCGCAPVYTDADGGDGGPGEPPDDAGEIEDAGSGAPGRIPARYVWKCVRPAPGCPRVRPRFGLQCVRPMTCDYGECVFEDGWRDGLSVQCFAGFWTKTQRARECKPDASD